MIEVAAVAFDRVSVSVWSLSIVGDKYLMFLQNLWWEPTVTLDILVAREYV